MFNIQVIHQFSILLGCFLDNFIIWEHLIYNCIAEAPARRHISHLVFRLVDLDNSFFLFTMYGIPALQMLCWPMKVLSFAASENNFFDS